MVGGIATIRNGVRRNFRTALEGGTANGLPAATATNAAQLSSCTGVYCGDGNTVTIVNHDRRLRVTAAGQRMFAAFASMDAADSAFLALHRGKAQSGIQAAMRGDSADTAAASIPRGAGRLMEFGRA